MMLRQQPGCPAPYYEDGTVTLYHGDCLDILPYLDPVDLVLTSPPYNLAQKPRTYRPREFRSLGGGYGVHRDDMEYSEYIAWQRSVLEVLWGLLTLGGAIFYNHKPIARGNEVRLPLELVPPGMPLRQVVIWDRGSGLNRNATHFVPAHEWVLVLARDEFRLGSRAVPDDVWRLAFHESSDHPAPFPLKFAKHAIAATSARVILDPFAGSGTTLRAAKDLGRHAIGIEIEERYCKMAARRCAQEVLDMEAA